MYQTIVGDDVGHRENPRMPALGQQVGARAGQRPARRDQLLVDAVHAFDHWADAVEVQARLRGRGQDLGAGAGRHEGTHRVGVELHVGVQVQAGERPCHLVAEAHRVRLSRYRRLDHAHTGYLSRGIGGTVGTCVGDDDDVELAGRGPGEQPAQVAREDGLLVVRRYHDADCRLAHAAQDNRCRDGETA